MAVPGRLLVQVFDTDTQTLTVTFRAKGGEGPPLLYVPVAHYPQGAVVLLDGDPLEFFIDPDSQRVLVQWDGSAGEHEIVVAPQ